MSKASRANSEYYKRLLKSTVHMLGLDQIFRLCHIYSRQSHEVWVDPLTFEQLKKVKGFLTITHS